MIHVTQISIGTVGRCGNCRFWKPATERARGECHCGTPTVVTTPLELTHPISGAKQLVLQAHGIWPPTTEADFCGCFKPAVKDADGKPLLHSDIDATKDSSDA